MEQVVLIAHVLVGVALVGLILLQQGKGAEMGASFGSGASQTLFGSGGSIGFLGRTTGVLAVMFFVTSIGLALIARDKAASAGEFRIEVPEVVEAPVLFEETNRPEDVPLDVPMVEVEPEMPVVQEDAPTADMESAVPEDAAMPVPAEPEPGQQ